MDVSSAINLPKNYEKILLLVSLKNCFIMIFNNCIIIKKFANQSIFEGFILQLSRSIHTKYIQEMFLLLCSHQIQYTYKNNTRIQTKRSKILVSTRINQCIILPYNIIYKQTQANFFGRLMHYVYVFWLILMIKKTRIIIKSCDILAC